MRASSTWDIPLLPLVRTGSRAIGKKKTMKKKEGGKTRDEEKGGNVRSGVLNRVIRGGSFDVNNEIASPDWAFIGAFPITENSPRWESKCTSFPASLIFNYGENALCEYMQKFSFTFVGSNLEIVYCYSVI